MFRLLFFASAALYSTALAQSTSFQGIFRNAAGINASAIDSSGNIYVVGTTTADNIPVTPGAFQTTFIASQCGTSPSLGPPFGSTPIPCAHGFVAKIDASGTHLVYATYLGGELQDDPIAIAVDANGSAYITGFTTSTMFPVTAGAWQPTLGTDLFDGFITKLNPQGSGLVFSTFLPGEGIALVPDAAGNVFVAGMTYGASFPTTPGAFQSTRFLGHEDVFVVKLNPTGTGPIYSTLLGGSLADVANALAIDASGNAYVAGYTASIPAQAGFVEGAFTPFPTTPGAVNRPGNGADVFVAKLNPSGTALVYSTVFGGSGDDGVNALTIDAAGAAYFAGYSMSVDFPTTPGAWRTTYGPGFAGKLSSDGTQLNYSTHLVGTPTTIAVDQAGNALIAGSTQKSDLPTTPNAILACFPSKGPSDVSAADYILELNATGTGLLYATYSRAAIAAGAPGEYYFASATAILDRVDVFAAVAPGINCVVNAASYRGPAIAPGEIVSIFGPAVGPEEAAGAVIDSSGGIATLLAGTRVVVGGVPAPLLYVSRNQINAVVPFDIAGQTQTSMQIETNGIESLPPFQTPVAAAAPGIFTLDGSGYGQAAALNQDGTLNSANNPAVQGSIVTLFVTGVGSMTPMPMNGSIPAGPLTQPVAPVSMNTSGIPSVMILPYVGDAPGLVEGTVQINAVLPKFFQTGPQILSLVAGPDFSPVGLNVTVFVR